MNQICISILNCKPENKFKIEALWFVFKSFCHQIFKNFGGGVGGGVGGWTEKSVFKSKEPKSVMARFQVWCLQAKWSRSPSTKTGAWLLAPVAPQRLSLPEWVWGRRLGLGGVRLVQLCPNSAWRRRWRSTCTMTSWTTKLAT